MFTKQQAQPTWNISILKICRCRDCLFFIHSFVGWLCSAFSVQRSALSVHMNDDWNMTFVWTWLQVFFSCVSFLLNHDRRYQRSSIYIVPLVTESIPFYVQRIVPLPMITTQAAKMLYVRWYICEEKTKNTYVIKQYFTCSCSCSCSMFVFMHTRRMSMHVLLWMDNYLKFRSCLYPAISIFHKCVQHCVNILLLLVSAFFFGVELDSQISTASRFQCQFDDWKISLVPFFWFTGFNWCLFINFVSKRFIIWHQIYACILMALNSKLLYSDQRQNIVYSTTHNTYIPYTDFAHIYADMMRCDPPWTFMFIVYMYVNI